MQSTIRARHVAALLAAAVSVPAMAEQPAAPAHYDAATKALVAEIDTFGDSKDTAKDPAGDLAKLVDLERRVVANGKLGPVDRGLLQNAFASAYFELKQYDKAVPRFEAAARLFEEGNAPPLERAGLYSNLATLLTAMQRYREAMPWHFKSLEMRKAVEGERGPRVAGSLFNLGAALYRQGRIEESLDYLRNAVDQTVEFNGPKDHNTVIRMASLATVLSRSGREVEALATARRAESLAREALGPDHPNYAIALNNLGNALVENGLYAEALPVFRQTMDARRRSIGEEASGTALSMRNLATVLKQTGALAEAEELTARATAIWEKSGETATPEALAYMLADQADFAGRRGDWAVYNPLAQRAIAAADKSLRADDQNRAQIHLYHAEYLRRQGDIAGALAIAEQWVPVMRSALIPSHKDRIAAEALLALLRAETGTGDVDAPAAAASTALVAKLGSLAVTDRQLIREAQTNRLTAERLLTLAVQRGDADAAFAALQLVNISDLAAGRQFAAENGGSEPLRAARAALLDLTRKTEELRTRQSAAIGKGAQAEAAELGGQLESALAARSTADRDFRAAYPAFVERFRPAPVSLAQFRASLAAGDMVVAPVETDGPGWLITIDAAHGLRAAPLDSPKAASLARTLRHALDEPATDGSFPYAEAAQLGAMLLPHGVPRGGQVLIYGGASLASLPWAALLSRPYTGALRDAPWLARDTAFAVITAPTATTGSKPAALHPAVEMAGIGGADLGAAPADGPVRVAGLFRSGQPAIDSISKLPPLPGAERELRSIAQALPGDDLILVGPDAREERLKARDLSKAQVLAFATHGLVSGEVAGLWEPALLVGTAPGSGEDGLLGASEIARLKLNADWVILSACNTAAGDSEGAPLYSGLATAFAEAGARGMMLSHWRVRDDAAARLTVDTVKGAAKGLSRAEALRRAQLRLMADRRVPGAAHPAVWAPFVIVE